MSEPAKAMAVVKSNNSTNANQELATGTSNSNEASHANSLLSEDEKKWTSKQWREALGAHIGMPIERSRPFFEKILSVYPLSGSLWIKYMEKEGEAGLDENVEALIARTLLTASSMEIWKFYIDFVKRTKLEPALKAGDETNVKQAREAMIQAYEYALDHVGFALDSTPIWRGYLTYLKDTEATTEYMRSRRMTSQRKLYGRAVVMPMDELDEVWKEYDLFENNLNRNTATVQLGELQQPYMQARAVVKDRKALVSSLSSDQFPSPFTGSAADEALLSKWRAVISFEQSNPERVVEAEALKKRVRFAFSQATASLMYYAEVWYDYAIYERETGDVDRAREILETAMKHVPDSMLLRFASADFDEKSGNVGAARKLYEAMVRDTPCPLVFIQFQRFARRAEGINAARLVFRSCRGLPECDHTVYVAAALLEYRINKQVQVAHNILELGMRGFGTEVDFLLEYLRFLMALNEENDTRAMFERALQLISGSDALPIWELYREFEVQWADADLGAVEQVEQRLRNALPEHGGLHGLLAVTHRYSFAGVTPPSDADLRLQDRTASLGARHAAAVRQQEAATARAQGVAASGAKAANQPQIAVPAFLKQLVSMLPPRFRGTPPDPDFAVRRLRDKPLPPIRPQDEPKPVPVVVAAAPATSAAGIGGEANGRGTKRKADGEVGVDVSGNTSECAFHLRQKMLRPNA